MPDSINDKKVGSLKLAGRDYSFYAKTGTVLKGGNNKLVETEISIHDGYGSSQNTTKHEFWIESVEGEQIPVQFQNEDIPILPGQKITLISAHSNKSNKRWLAMFVNHETNSEYYLSRIDEELVKNRYLMKISLSLIIGLILSLVAGHDGIRFLTDFILISGFIYGLVFQSISNVLKRKDAIASKAFLKNLTEKLSAQ